MISKLKAVMLKTPQKSATASVSINKHDLNPHLYFDKIKQLQPFLYICTLLDLDNLL